MAETFTLMISMNGGYFSITKRWKYANEENFAITKSGSEWVINDMDDFEWSGFKTVGSAIDAIERGRVKSTV